MADAEETLKMIRRLVTKEPGPETGVSEPWLTLEQAAAYVGVRDQGTIRRWIRSGLKCGKAGNTTRVKASYIDDFLLSAGVKGEQPPEGDESNAAQAQQTADSPRLELVPPLEPNLGDAESVQAAKRAAEILNQEED